VNTQLCLVCTDLACRRGERRLFSGLGFRLGSGQIAIVSGPNGAGKTTLLRTVAGFLRPEAGRIALDGAGPEASLAEHAHFLGHRDGLRGALSVRENLLSAARMLGGEGGLTPEAALARLDLARLIDLPLGVLSAGQRRRVALARLLVARRALWILDEPTAALDAASQATVARLLGEHAASGGMVLAATHLDLGVAAMAIRLGDPA
jgi:heme exporter protein A